MSYGAALPLARRSSDRVVPPGTFAYSRSATASSTPRVPRLTASIGSTPARAAQRMNSSQTELVGLRRVPGEVQPARSRSARPDPVLPAVAGDEVAAGIAHDRDAQLADEVKDVLAEPVGVGAWVAGLIDAGVDATGPCARRRSRRGGDGPRRWVRRSGSSLWPSPSIPQLANGMVTGLRNAIKGHSRSVQYQYEEQEHYRVGGPDVGQRDRLR